MERAALDTMAALDQVHWWYVARRKVLAAFIARSIRPAANARILEIGCGTGHNLAMLGQFGEVDAVEIDDQSRAIASARLGRPIFNAPLPALDGVAEGDYDLIALLDVLEHIDDDRAALASIARRLKPGGRILVAVPAHRWLWSDHDVANHHCRRYTRRTLKASIAGAGLKLETMTAINSLLFPLAVVSRLVGRLTGKTGSDDKLPFAPLNWAFERVFAAEAPLMGRIQLPIGVSLVAAISA